MTVAEYQLQVDWDGDGTFGGSTDVTGRTFAVEWARGRDNASQLLGRSVAGRFAARLNNQSGDYNSFNTASPLNGKILPGRLVRLRGTADGTVFNLWQGYLDRILPEPSIKDVNVAVLEAMGPLGYLNQKAIQLGMVTNANTGSIIDDILDAAGWSTANRSIDGGRTTLSRFWVDNEKTIEALRRVEEAESGFIMETKDGKIGFENRQHRFLSPHTVSQGTLTDASAGTLGYVAIFQDDPLPYIFNTIEASIITFSVGTLAILWTHPETGTASPKIDRDGNSRIFWARYPTPDSPTDAIGVDAWTTPVSGTDYVANTSAAGTGTDITSDIGLATSKYGNEMKMTFTNNNATADAYLTKIQARGTPVTADDPTKISSEDGTSQTLYGKRTRPTPTPLPWPDSKELEYWLDYQLALYKRPAPVLQVTIHANRDLTHLKQALTRDISDRLTVIATGNTGLGINTDFYIEAEVHAIDRDRRHMVTLLCSEGAKSTDFWVFDKSKLDDNARFSY